VDNHPKEKKMKKWMMAMMVLALAASASAAEKKAKKAEADAEAAKAGWTTALNAGLTMTDGNSETMAVNASLVTEGEKDGLGSVIAGIEANYGENTAKTETENEDGSVTVTETDETTIENAKAYVNVKKTLSPKTFASLDGSVLYDDIALIDYRAMLGPGLGFYVVKNDKRELSLEAGSSYVWEKLDGESNAYLALRFAERYTCQITETAKLVQSLEYVPEAEDFDNYLLTAEAGIEAAINDHLSLRVVLQDKYDNTPAPGAERNDVSLIAGLSYTL
jgi:putative salt-induced outer membrane protein YdiY